MLLQISLSPPWFLNCWLCRQPDLYEESSGSSEYSTGSTLPSHLPLDKVEQCQSELCAPYQDVRPVSQSTHAGDQHQLVKVENTMLGSEPTDKGIKMFIMPLLD